MASTACARCDAVGQSGNFCTSCGYDLRPPEPAVVTPRHRPRPEPPAVVTCGACGALNAKSRQVCARCRSPLREGVAPSSPAAPRAAEPSGHEYGPAVRAGAPPARSPALLRAVVALAAAVLLIVTGTLLAARRGAVPSGPDASASLVQLAVAGASSSSAADGEGPERVADGDPGTAWTEDAAGPGVGEWLELRLDEPARLLRLTVWNGDQRGERFVRRNRVRELRIQVGQARFTVELLDTQGPQVIELPRRVRAARLRLTVVSVHGASPDADTSLSELQVYGAPAG